MSMFKDKRDVCLRHGMTSSIGNVNKASGLHFSTIFKNYCSL